MGLAEAEIGEVEQQQKNHHPLGSLGRQSSIYSLTLDEFQQALNESGKNFGSMNMDEFLTSIWNAEESQAARIPVAGNNNSGANLRQPVKDNAFAQSISRQPSLPRQASLTIPAPLCRKTVDEVWSEIHGGRQKQGQAQSAAANSAARQPTFGELTLEDFLIKAGVVREQQTSGVQTRPVTQYPQFGLCHAGGNQASAQGLISKTFLGIGYGSEGYKSVPSLAYAEDGKKAGRYTGGEAGQQSGPPGVCYNAAVQGMGMAGHPMSPVPSEGLVSGQVENGGCQYGVEVGVFRGRKRIVDGPVEKVVERRQRRMIKNRESAARSRARKQAYTVELEAELNQLKDENYQLRQALAELEMRRKRQYLVEEPKMKAQTRAQITVERLKKLRRAMSCPL